MTTACPAEFHGTSHFYRRYRCRCPEAVEAKRAENRHRASSRIRARRPRTYYGGSYADEIAVERAVNGDTTLRLTSAELAEAIEALDRLRMSAREIAVRLGITARTVVRHRQRRNAPAQECGAAALPDRCASVPPPEDTNSDQDGTAPVRQEGMAA